MTPVYDETESGRSPEHVRIRDERWLNTPEHFERCPVEGCQEWRYGVVCRNHWDNAPPELKVEVRKHRGDIGSEASQRANKQFVLALNARRKTHR